MIVFQAGPRQTFIHRVDPRVRVVAAALFAVVVCVGDHIPALVSALVVALIVSGISGIGASKMLRRLVSLNVFMLFLLVFLPVSVPGESVFSVDGFHWTREGFYKVGLIALRADAIMVMLIALIGIMEPAHLGFALSQLKVPQKLTEILLFMVRYVEVIHHEYHRLRDAMRLRAFRAGFNRHTFRSFGYLVGMLLVNSLDRSDRILEAMKCRGFTGRFHVLTSFHFKTLDAVFGALATIYLITLVWLENL